MQADKQRADIGLGGDIHVRGPQNGDGVAAEQVDRTAGRGRRGQGGNAAGDVALIVAGDHDILAVGRQGAAERVHADLGDDAGGGDDLAVRQDAVEVGRAEARRAAQLRGLVRTGQQLGAAVGGSRGAVGPQLSEVL